MPRVKRTVIRAKGGENISFRDASRVVRAVHLISNESGRWSVRTTGSPRIDRSFPDEAAALDYIRSVPRLAKSELIRHAPGGEVDWRPSWTRTRSLGKSH